MKMKLVFSLVLSLVLVIPASSAILFTDTPSPVLAQENGGHNGGDGGGHNGGGDSGGHNGGGDDGGHNGGDDDGHNGDDSEQHEWAEVDVEALWQIEPPEGQELGDVQNIRDVNGDVIVTEDGVPLLGRQIFDKNTGEPILNYDDWGNGEPIYITNAGRVSVPVTYYRELGPGFRSGPGYERYKYTPPPGFGDPNGDDQTDDSPSPSPTPDPENQDEQTDDSPSPAPTSESENADDQTPETLPVEPVPESTNQDGGPSPSEAFDDDTQFGEPQPVMDPTGNPLTDEGGAPVLGQTVLDEEGEPVIGPNGKPIIVIPD